MVTSLGGLYRAKAATKLKCTAYKINTYNWWVGDQTELTLVASGYSPSFPTSSNWSHLKCSHVCRSPCCPLGMQVTQGLLNWKRNINKRLAEHLIQWQAVTKSWNNGSPSLSDVCALWTPSQPIHKLWKLLTDANLQPVAQWLDGRINGVESSPSFWPIWENVCIAVVP